MKTNSISSSLLFLHVLVPQLLFAQGHFLPRNILSPLIDAPVYDSLGVPLTGTNYYAEVWGSASQDSLTPLVQIGSGYSRLLIPFISDGYFVGSATGLLSVTNIPPGGYAWLQVRAWDARLGETYEQVAALGIGGYGESGIFYAQGGDPTAFPPQSPRPLVGLQSFSLRPVVPEPSAVALVVLGSLSLWLRSRSVKRSLRWL